MSKIGKFLYGNWYGSAVCFAAVLVALTGLGFAEVFLQYSMPEWLGYVSNGLTILLAVMFLNGLAAIIVSLAQKRWKRAVVQTCLGIFLILGMICVMAVLTFLGMFGPSDDHFADNLKMPTDVKVSVPIDLDRERRMPGALPRDDAYSLALYACATNALMSRGKIVCDITPLDELAHDNMDLLKRYLVSHPGWDVRNDRFSGLVANRRTRQYGRWVAGHDSQWSMDLPVEPDGEECFNDISAYCTICFGKVRYDGIKCKSGDEVKVKLEKKIDSMKRCEIVCKGENVTAIVSEASLYTSSRVMQPVFDFTKAEFAAVKKAGNWEEVKKLLPHDAIRRGEATFELYKGSQGGIYNYAAWVNPGEPGEVYLKAYEVTKGTRLSEGRLGERTRGYVGWSDDPEEKFSVGSEFTIYEGDWEKYYAARIELWFVPANGGKERKLTERVFKVEGWMR